MNDRVRLREKRHRRVRYKVSGTGERPRLNVFRSSKHIYAQLIDDEQGRTIVAASSVEPDFRSGGKSGANLDAAKAIGTLIAERAKEKGVESVVFDRGGWRYMGRIQQLADAAREGGLKF
jgi:large subunit ribosomal protein L18